MIFYRKLLISNLYKIDVKIMLDFFYCFTCLCYSGSQSVFSPSFILFSVKNCTAMSLFLGKIDTTLNLNGLTNDRLFSVK